MPPHVQLLGFSVDNITSIDRVLAAILHLGNIQFESDKEHVGSTITTPAEPPEVARLLGMEEEQVVKILTIRLLASQKEVVEAKLPPRKAKYSRDTLAKV
jgi:myosin-1